MSELKRCEYCNGVGGYGDDVCHKCGGSGNNCLIEIAKLKELLIIRDGGGHDVDCKSNYNRSCNCGHDSVEEYFNEAAK